MKKTVCWVPPDGCQKCSDIGSPAKPEKQALNEHHQSNPQPSSTLCPLNTKRALKTSLSHQYLHPLNPSNYNPINILFRIVKSIMKHNDCRWQSSSESSVDLTDLELAQPNNRNQKALSILREQKHSLEPDMISGWRPRITACPLPLIYRNWYTDTIVQNVRKCPELIFDPKVVYVSQRCCSSVKLNQSFTYFWRYRTLYSTNNAAIASVEQQLGESKNPLKNLPLTASPHLFSAEFESGNLDMVINVRKSQYDCFIRSDTNTKGHTNWFYFKMSNRSQTGPVVINICNMSKNTSMYSKGMKPYAWTGNDCQHWSQQLCYNVKYLEKYCMYGVQGKTYNLQFMFDFIESNQEIYFAYGIPYTYSQLQLFIREIRTKHPDYVQYKKLCESLGGLDIPLLTITSEKQGTLSKEEQDEPELPERNKRSRKKVAVVTARIHPGQSNSSYVLEGFIRKLLSGSREAHFLRQNFILYIVPMINPDGVVAGNYRTSYSGKDLNRQFSDLNRFLYPQIAYLHDLCKGLIKKRHGEIDFYFDFHTHSSRSGLFCYGPEHRINSSYYWKSKMFAKIMEKHNDIFDYKQSVFMIGHNKLATGRAHMLNAINVPMTFTFEVSNGLVKDNCTGETRHVTEGLLKKSGEQIAIGLHSYIIFQSSKQQDEANRPKLPSKSRQIQLGMRKILHKKTDNFFPHSTKTRLNHLNKTDIVMKFQQTDDYAKLLASVKQQSHKKRQTKQILTYDSDHEDSTHDLETEDMITVHNTILKYHRSDKIQQRNCRKLKTVEKSSIDKKSGKSLNSEMRKLNSQRNNRYGRMRQPVKKQQIKENHTYLLNTNPVEKSTVAMKNFQMLL